MRKGKAKTTLWVYRERRDIKDENGKKAGAEKVRVCFRKGNAEIEWDKVVQGGVDRVGRIDGRLDDSVDYLFELRDAYMTFAFLGRRCSGRTSRIEKDGWMWVRKRVSFHRGGFSPRLREACK